MKLTRRQAIFVQEYLVDLNATKAASRAGYSCKTATEQGARLLTKVNVQEAIQQGLRTRLQKAELTAEANLEQIRRGSQFDVRDLFDEKGNLRPIKELTAEQAAPIAGFDVVQRNLTSGDDEVDTVIKVRLADRARYVEMAAKYFGQLTDRLHISGDENLLKALAEGRRRVATSKARPNRQTSGRSVK